MPKRASQSSDDTKLRELILYLADRSADDPAFGKTKLNKQLFFCDFLAFKYLGQSITGHPYRKLEHGPVPRQLPPILRTMEQSGDCKVVIVDYHGHEQHRVVAQRPPNRDVFTEDELRLVEAILAELRYSNGKNVSDISHRFIGWQAAEDGDDIPYETVFVDPPRKLTADEVRACKVAAATHA